jgi:hypothetical protein
MISIECRPRKLELVARGHRDRRRLMLGASAPKLVTRKILKAMKRGAVIVDIAIDQGGTALRPMSSTVWCTTASPICRDRFR